MNFRILAAPALAARAGFGSACRSDAVGFGRSMPSSLPLRPPPPPRREKPPQGRSEAGRARGTAAAAPAAQAPRRRQPAAQPPAEQQQIQLIYAPWTKFCLKGQDASRQAGLLHRQGRPHRVRPARHRRRHHRARRRAEEDPARHAAARHAAGARHPHHRRQQSAGAEPLCDLLRQWLHVGLRSHAGMLANMKKGQNLVVQAINSNGAPLTLAAAAGRRWRLRQGL